jgi:hypothetical protein
MRAREKRFFGADSENGDAMRNFLSSLLRASTFFIATLLAGAGSLALSPAATYAQQPQAAEPAPTSAPIPAQIAAAKNIFISNMGADPGGLQILTSVIKDRDATYNQFYAALKSWGHFQIVAKPSDADLVLQLGLVDHAAYPARMTLVIYDEQSHYPLWTLSEPLQPAARSATWQKNFTVCVNALIGDLQRLATPVSY